jgi:transcriptional regulator with XRE-family HTH domain
MEKKNVTEADTDAAQFLRQVGRRLQAARTRAGYTLDQVASFMGHKSRASVGHWETGQNPIDIAKLRRLARHYETTVVALLADELSSEDLVALVKRGLESQAPAAVVDVLLKPGATVEPDKTFKPPRVPAPQSPAPGPRNTAARNAAAPKAGAKPGPR